MGKSNEFDPDNAGHRALAEVVAEQSPQLPPWKQYELLKAINEGRFGKVDKLIGPK